MATTHRLRSFIVWLLALALPWHAAVVAAMTYGVTGAGDAMAAAAVEVGAEAAFARSFAAAHLQSPHHDDGSQAAHPPHRDDAAAAPAADADASMDDCDPAHHGADPSAKRCSVPASCCIWAACLPPPLQAAADAPPAPAPAAAPAGPVVFLTDGPLRPPRARAV